MIGSKRTLTGRKHTLVERLGLGIFALSQGRVAKIVENPQHRLVTGTERGLGCGERATIERLRIGSPALRRIGEREIKYCPGTTAAVLAELPAACFDRLLGNAFGLRKTARTLMLLELFEHLVELECL